MVKPFDADNKGQLWLFVHKKSAILFAQTSQANLLAFCIAVFLDVGLRALEDDLPLLFIRLDRVRVSVAQIDDGDAESMRGLCRSAPKDG